MIELWVSGRPAPQGSKRHVGGGRMIEMSKAVGPWREAVRSEAQAAIRAGAAPLEGAAMVMVTFYLAAPKTVKRVFPSVRPDLDKLTRAVLDGLTMGEIVTDDAQVTDLFCFKRYGGRTGALVRVAPATALISDALANALAYSLANGAAK